MPPYLYSLADCASVSNRSPSTVSRMIREGRGPVRQRVGQQFVITEPDLLRWIAVVGVRS